MEFSRQEHWSGLPFPSPRLSKKIYRFPVELPVAFFAELEHRTSHQLSFSQELSISLHGVPLFLVLCPCGLVECCSLLPSSRSGGKDRRWSHLFSLPQWNRSDCTIIALFFFNNNKLPRKPVKLSYLANRGINIQLRLNEARQKRSPFSHWISGTIEEHEKRGFRTFWL